MKKPRLDRGYAAKIIKNRIRYVPGLLKDKLPMKTNFYRRDNTFLLDRWNIIRVYRLPIYVQWSLSL